VLQAYIDDSASQQGDRKLFLAGYVHDAAQWALFSNDWDAVLHEAPVIEYFKMSEAQNLSEQFRHWSAPQRDRKIERLIDVIVKHKPWSIQCSVSQRLFNEIVLPVAPYELRHPYGVCFHGIVIGVARIHREMGLTVPVDFIFDEQGSVGDDAVVWYRQIKKHQSPEIRALMGSTPIFKSDRDVLLLQAADLLAWHVRRDDESGDAYAKRRVMFGPKHRGLEITEEVLRGWAAGFANRIRIPGASVMTSAKHGKRRKAEMRRLLTAGVDPPPLWHFLWRYYLERLREFFRVRLNSKRRRGRNEPR
jgi:hypothetical protein